MTCWYDDFFYINAFMILDPPTWLKIGETIDLLADDGIWYVGKVMDVFDDPPPKKFHLKVKGYHVEEYEYKASKYPCKHVFSHVGFKFP
jgi:hypothetical protein